MAQRSVPGGRVDMMRIQDGNRSCCRSLGYISYTVTSKFEVLLQSKWHWGRLLLALHPCNDMLILLFLPGQSRFAENKELKVLAL